MKLGVRLNPSGKVVAPKLRDADREQKVTLPAKPSVGEAVGLAVTGDHGVLLHFEMQATKGSGRIVPLGSIQKVMRPIQSSIARSVELFTPSRLFGTATPSGA